MQSTMRDVAKAAGVSIKTVSRVVNQQGEISEDTRQRVLAAIQKLEYRPSKLARALVTQRTDTIGLLLGDITNPYSAEVARGVLDFAQEHDYDVFVCNTGGRPALEKRALYSLIDHNIDGTIIFPTWENQAWVQELASPARPLVAINKKIKARPGLSVIRTKIREGAALAVAYLIEQGHRHIGLIAGDDGPPEALDRFKGYRDALELRDIPFREELIRCGQPVMKHGTVAARCLLSENPELSAIFCYNDLIAIGAIQACKALGREVPDACAIVGFDNIMMSALIHPPLTTIHVNKYEIGRLAAERLLTMLEDPESDFPPLIIDVELIRRKST